MNKLLMSVLLFLNFTCSACLFDSCKDDQAITLARFGLLAYYYEKADKLESIQEYIGQALFGKRWKGYVENTELDLKSRNLYGLPFNKYAFVETKIIEKAHNDSRQDVRDFLESHSVFDDPKFDN